MKVFLKKTVPRLGKAGEEVLVKNGYARNFLIPQKIAVAIKDSNLKILERQKIVIFEEKRIASEKALEIAKKLKGVLLEFSLKANPSGKLFGSITSKNIVDELVKQDVHLDRKCLDLTTPLKEVGQYSVDVVLTDEIVEKIRVVVTIEKTEETKETSSTKKTEETKETSSTKKTEATKETSSTKKTEATKETSSTKKTEATKETSSTKKTEETKPVKKTTAKKTTKKETKPVKKTAKKTTKKGK